ncbi:hypothetical protein Tsubulata_041335 [Turnera subulata]|uniref:TITAN-like protein n=1 Tax=Turnera subulata TaxID=218843 RepID=A0A9Q0F520_9ROSI|nr:hypothetical protein Tsubulata_041335 [Turnera subulata]
MNRKINNGNRNNANREKKKKEEDNEKQKSEFEFCKICRVDHNEGPRHKYFPKHKQSLSVFLSRFQSKLADVRFFLRNPSLLRPEHASRNRLWCVFCDADLVESDSSFACENAINHLASEDHLKKLKHFLWKNGGGMDRVDMFRISEADVAKCLYLLTVVGEEVQGTQGWSCTGWKWIVPAASWTIE